MTDAISPGDHIESRCTRCHDITGHVVIVLIDNEISKVECRACGSIHKYYPLKTSNKKRKDTNGYFVRSKEHGITTGDTIQTSSQGLPAKKTQSKSRKSIEGNIRRWQEAINSSFGMPKLYSMMSQFDLGDIIEHPKFGKGIVQELVPPDKIQVLFEDGFKLLKSVLNSIKE